MTLDLEPEVESQLLAYASAEGTTATEYVSRWLREKESTQHFGISANKETGARVSALGTFAGVLNSEEFMRRKHEEIEREDRKR